MPKTRVVRWISVLAAMAGASCGDGPTVPNISSAAGQLAVGEQTACALDATGALYCWGLNSSFLEYGVDPATAATSDAPVRVSAPPFSALMPGVSQHMCAQASGSNGVYCWGRGGAGQLGGGGVEGLGNAFTLVAGSSWNVVTVSRLTSCGVTTLGTGLCWGTNQRGEVGTAGVAIGRNSALPVPVDGGTKFKMIAAGWLHACGIATDDRVFCWGDNRHGQLGNGNLDSDDTPADAHIVPVAVATDKKFLMLSSGALQTCGITTDNHVVCWGDNETGQLGDGTTTDRAFPTAIASDQSFRFVSVGSGFRGGALANPTTTVSAGGAAHTCALTTTGLAYCWGWNGDGQLGDGTKTDHLAPIAVAGGLPFSTIGAGGAFTCAMRGHQVTCWGSNSTGQIGYGQGKGGTLPFPRTVVAPFDKP